MNIIFGRPVEYNEFIDREDTIQAVFNRLRNHESTAIIGTPNTMSQPVIYI
jgi:hypothetical protein